MVLTEIIREEIGKTSFEVKEFFQELIQNGELKVYNVEFDKKIIVSDDENEKITRIQKGATVSPTTYFPDVALIEDVKTGSRYRLKIKSGQECHQTETNQIYNTTTETQTHEFELEKLSEDFDSKTLKKAWGRDFLVPLESVKAKLDMRYYITELPIGDQTRKCLTITGQKDSLFDRVYDFIRGEGSP